MRAVDHLAFCLRALRERALRTALSVLGIAVAVAAVILLTSIGEGARLQIIGQFQQFGTNIVQVTPGKTETFGIPGALGGTTHKLTVEDAEALRRVVGVERVVPSVFGQARVEGATRGRSVYVLGVNSEALDVWKLEMQHGSFLPAGDVRRGSSVAVLGPGLERELFGDHNAVGEWVRVAGRRLRVIGITAPKGRILGFDMDDCAYVPVATALAMFNLEELMEIDVTLTEGSRAELAVAGLRETLRKRHGGKDDVTILTQAEMLGVFDDVMRIVTLGVVAIAAIAFFVGAIGILTVMWISVGERTPEIGLLRALGATPAQVRSVFLTEAAALAGLGGLAGGVTGLATAQLLTVIWPQLPVSVPLRFAALALLGCIATGLLSGHAPAQRAARLNPIEALHAD